MASFHNELSISCVAHEKLDIFSVIVNKLITWCFKHQTNRQTKKKNYILKNYKVQKQKLKLKRVNRKR